MMERFAFASSLLVFSVLLRIGHMEPEPPVNQEQMNSNFNSRPSSSYGPPGYTPGQPLGLDSSSSGYNPSSSNNNCPPNDPQRNKALVLKAYQEVFGDHKTENIDEYFAEGYIQHNPLGADGKDALRELVGHITDPPQQIPFFRTAAEDDLVWTHSRIVLFGVTYAAADIFRIECGKIKEHWDVLQDTNLKMPSRNPHPFF